MKLRGFTLAELLIALAILGVIATFTIPKVLNSSTNEQNNSLAKEAVGMISGAVFALKLDGISASTEVNDLTPYLNYVSADTTSNLDGSPGDGGADYDCSNAISNCFKLHSGASIAFWRDTNCHILGDSDTDGAFFLFSPDSSIGGSNDSIWFVFTPQGRIKTWGEAIASSDLVCGGVPPQACVGACEPSWFSW